MKYFLLGAFGIGPFAIVFAAVTDPTSPTTGSVAPWLTAGAVLSLAGLVWKIQNDRIRKLEAERDSLIEAANRRAEEDRKLLIPLLSRSVEAQAAYMTRLMAPEQPEG